MFCQSIPLKYGCFLIRSKSLVTNNYHFNSPKWTNRKSVFVVRYPDTHQIGRIRRTGSLGWNVETVAPLETQFLAKIVQLNKKTHRQNLLLCLLRRRRMKRRIAKDHFKEDDANRPPVTRFCVTTAWLRTCLSGCSNLESSSILPVTPRAQCNSACPLTRKPLCGGNSFGLSISFDLILG